MSLSTMKLDLPKPLRSAKTLGALLLAGCMIVAWYALVPNDSEPAAAISQQQLARQPVAASLQVSPPTTPLTESAVTDAGPTTVPSAESIAKLIRDATEGDADSRADAIFALARAPAAQVVPVLHGIIVSGDIVNGHLALDSLRTMALNQGDSDGAIRNSVRFAIYHSTSDTITQSAQEILDELEKPAEPAAP